MMPVQPYSGYDLSEEPPTPAGATIAGFWQRLLAFAIDGMVLGILGALLGATMFDTLAGLGAWGRLVGFVIALAYFGTLNSSLGGGQTIGKRLLRIRVVDLAGRTISPLRASLRHAVFGIPFFLNSAHIPVSAAPSPITIVIGFLVFGVGGANLYLYLFNRRTRQSLPDLAAQTYVVRAQSAAAAPRVDTGIPRAHLIVVSVWLALNLIVCVLAPSLLARLGLFPDMQKLAESLQQSGKISTAEVQDMTFWGTGPKKRRLTVNAYWKKPPVSEQSADEVAAIALQSYPPARKVDEIAVQVTYGFDLGFASGWQSYHAIHSPAEWEKNKEPAPR